MTVNFLGVKVNAIDNGSLLNFGPNQWTGQFIAYKRNQGFGEQNGDFVPVIIPICYVFDQDLADNPSVKNSIF